MNRDLIAFLSFLFIFSLGSDLCADANKQELFCYLLPTNVPSAPSTQKTQPKLSIISTNLSESSKEGSPKAESGFVKGYNAPANIKPQGGWNWHIYGAFLFMQAIERGLEIGYIDCAGEGKTVEILPLDFSFNNAFRVGLGFNSCRDDWVFLARYTRYKNSCARAENITGKFSSSNFLRSSWISEDLFIPLGFSEANYNFIKGKWDLNFNIIEFFIGRPFFMGKRILIKPNFGIACGWIDQSYFFDGTVPNPSALDKYFSAHLDSCSKQWFIGPKVGVEIEYLLKSNFKIFSNISNSLSYQKYKTSICKAVSSTDIMGKNIFLFSKKNNSDLNPSLEFSLGIGYGRYFYNDEWHLDISVGYELDYLWNIGMIQYLSKKNGCSENFISLVIHGANIGLKIDF